MYEWTGQRTAEASSPNWLLRSLTPILLSLSVLYSSFFIFLSISSIQFITSSSCIDPCSHPSHYIILYHCFQHHHVLHCVSLPPLFPSQFSYFSDLFPSLSIPRSDFHLVSGILEGQVLCIICDVHYVRYDLILVKIHLFRDGRIN